MDNNIFDVSEDNAPSATGFLPSYGVIYWFLFLAIVVGLDLVRHGVGRLHVVDWLFFGAVDRCAISSKFRVSLDLIHGVLHASTAFALISRPRRLKSNILQVL